MTFARLCKRVRAAIGQRHRYVHCVRVARTAEALARRHGLDAGKARIAGMLHDLARLHDPERLLRESAAYGVEIDDFAAAHPIVLHAPVSAALARTEFGVNDPEVLSAIAKHTLGDARMSPLDCVLYLADSLEPGRAFAEREALLALAATDLRAAMRATIASSLRYLTAQHLSVAPQTAAAMRAFGDTTLEAGTAASS